MFRPRGNREARVTDNKNPGAKNEGIQANSVKAEVMAVGRNASAVQNRFGETSDAFQQTLNELMLKLQEALQQVPQTHQEDAQVIAELANELKEKATAEK